ncbi:putative sugar phosphate phosphate translocator [Micractinium conductrix]|uniref:Sugar phosphate phosphate translocator n=1 Tax=Micractinium conductrix TaxID=554055 RepID=A0A2P6VMB1_9CHLO|nr:putative sugar phosphate phosphate translocator [Micractinium conductrix]|eukprot:PSC75246.1 putative sugar phosphate phosphate translocator [Micractinium conductrix]
MSSLTTGVVILSWYGSNIGVLMLNKYLLSIFGFRYPVFLTLCHMLACSCMSYGVAASRLVTLQPVTSRRQFYKISLLALIFCLTVVLGNVSLKFIPVSFNQAIGATTPAFTALLAWTVMHTRETPPVYASLVPVVVGVVIASGAEPMFNMVGFLAAVTAASARALKSVLQGLMLSDSHERMDSLSLLMYMAPVAVVALIPTTLFFEPDAAAQAIELGRNGMFWMLLLFNSFLAYFVNLTNFLVTKHTSALTLQVLGNAKGVVAVVLSLLYFRNPINFYSIFGYAVTVCGVVLYSQAKKAAKKAQLLQKMASGDPSVVPEAELLLATQQEAGSSGKGEQGAPDTAALLRAAEKLGTNGYGNGHSYIHIPANGSTAAGQGKASTRSIPLISQDSSRPFSMTRGYSSVYEA